jgi:hypothetical protein
MNETIKLSRGNAGIDALILNKDRALEGIVEIRGIPIEKIGFIGDEVIDLPLLTTPGLGLVGAPSNAQDRVKAVVEEQTNGFVSSQKVYGGFLEFYGLARGKGLKLIISDKDGVLKHGGNTQWGDEFRNLVMKMGKDQRPYVCVLTGSSISQNQPFMEKYGLDSELGANPKIQEHPHLLLVENGAIHVNVLDGTTRNYVHEISPDLLEALKNDFEPKVRGRLEREVFPEFGFSYTEVYEDQKGKVYHAREKQSMVTFNVPRQFRGGNEFRKSPESEGYRDNVIRVMESVVQELDLPYEKI